MGVLNSKAFVLAWRHANLLKRNNPPCPIHCASLCGMGGKPGISDFPDPFHPLGVDEAGERLTCRPAKRANLLFLSMTSPIRQNPFSRTELERLKPDSLASNQLSNHAEKGQRE